MLSRAFRCEDIFIMSDLEPHRTTVLCILTDYEKATMNSIHQLLCL